MAYGKIIPIIAAAQTRTKEEITAAYSKALHEYRDLLDEARNTFHDDLRLAIENELIGVQQELKELRDRVAKMERGTPSVNN